MQIVLSKLAQAIQPSPTLAVSARAATLKQQGRDIISLSAGEPDFDTPAHIKAAAIEALDQGLTKYTPASGTPALKQAIVEKFQRENNLDYTPDEILVSCGAKHSLYNLMQALLNPGDEVLIAAPYWVSYPDMVMLAGATPIIMHTEIKNAYKLTAAELQQAITPKTRLLIINSPSNPTGICYSDTDLQQFAEVLLSHPELIIVTDDIYEHILWGQDKFHNIVNICPELKNRSIVVNGVSKAYSMTGWRIGYAAGPVEIIRTMGKIQSQSTSNPTSIAQYAAQAALQGDQSYIKKSRDIFKSRHDFVLQALRKIPDIVCHPADGTFYCFPDLSSIIERLDGVSNDIELGEYLLEEAEVAIVPGSAFGAPGAIRISFATDLDTLQSGMQRLTMALS